MSTVCFRHRPATLVDELSLEAHNRALMAAVNESGAAFISHAVLSGRFVLRASIGNVRTTPEDVGQLWEALQFAAQQ
jgi:aromatic-L-amino-acid decarboxylase